jgi:hypothetical protein
MQHPILTDGLISKDGRSLTYTDNAHLFRWPGALVYGAAVAVATDEQDIFAQPKDITDWGRDRYRTGESRAPYVDRDRALDPDRPAPELTPRQLREQYLQPWRVAPVEVSPDNPQFARGNEAAAFEARRNRDQWMAQGRDIENPLLARLNIKTLAADWPGGNPAPEFNEGAQWALDALANDFFDGPIIPPVLLNAAGPRQAGALLATYLNSPHAAEIVRRFQASIWAGIARRIDEKIAQVEHELSTWARAGQLPVSRPEGGTDEALSLANAITATVGIYHLANLGRALVDFKRTGEAAIAGVLEGLK